MSEEGGHRQKLSLSGMDGRLEHTPGQENSRYRRDQPDEEIAEQAVEFWKWLQRQNIQVHQWIIAIFTIVIAFSSIGYGIVTLLQWSAMKESNQITRDSLTTVQRAFVNPSASVGAIALAPLDAKGEASYLQFSVPFINNGNTPAVEMAFYCNARVFDHELTGADDLRDFDSNRKYSVYLAPRGETNCYTDIFIPASDIRRAEQSGSSPLYIYGWATYKDVFGVLHKLKFLYRMSGTTMKDPLTGDPNSHFNFIIPGLHNCVDQECDVRK